MKQVICTCDECSEEIAEYGFELGNQDQLKTIKERATLERRLHFCSLLCLREWSTRAVVAAEELEADANRLQPHGTLHKGPTGLVVN